jgi:adenosylhomocysteine nucleosidase
MTLAILSALADEQRGLLDALRQSVRVSHAKRDVWRGRWHGQEVVLALSGIGKVAAASTACSLIETFGVTELVFTGVAGGLASGVQVGDAVIGQTFLQHDLDARPLYERYEIPLYGRQTFDADAVLSQQLRQAIEQAACDLPETFSIHEGLIISGDQFISDAAVCARLREDVRAAGQEPLAVEMEGAAVAQVCFDHEVAFAAVRTISDRADDNAHLDFSKFVKTVAGPRATAILAQLLALRQQRSG